MDRPPHVVCSEGLVLWRGGGLWDEPSLLLEVSRHWLLWILYLFPCLTAGPRIQPSPKHACYSLPPATADSIVSVCDYC